MSNTANKLFFGRIGKRPVLGLGNIYGVYCSRKRAWQHLQQSDLVTVVWLTRRSFLRRFGTKISSLPEWGATAFISLKIVGGNGIAGICGTATKLFSQE